MLDIESDWLLLSEALFSSITSVYPVFDCVIVSTFIFSAFDSLLSGMIGSSSVDSLSVESQSQLKYPLFLTNALINLKYLLTHSFFTTDFNLSWALVLTLLRTLFGFFQNSS